MVDHNRSLSQTWGSNAARPQSFGHSDERTAENVADIYNQAGDDYVAYADGDPTQPFAFDGMHASADVAAWLRPGIGILAEICHKPIATQTPSRLE